MNPKGLASPYPKGFPSVKDELPYVASVAQINADDVSAMQSNLCMGD